MTDAIKRIRDALDHGDFGPMLADDVEELLAERDALLEALQHMQHCASCAEDDWQNCEGGRAALAAIDAARGKE